MPTPAQNDPLASMPDTLGDMPDTLASAPIPGGKRLKSPSSEEIIQQETGIHPFKSPVAQTAAGPVRAVWGMIRSPYDLLKAAYAPPQTPEEMGVLAGGGAVVPGAGNVGLLLDRMLVHPAVAAHQAGTEERAQAVVTRGIAKKIEAAANDAQQLKTLQKQYPQYDLSTPDKARGVASDITRTAITNFAMSLPTEMGAVPILGPMGQAAGARMAAGDIPGAITESLANAFLLGAPETAAKVIPHEFITRTLPKEVVSHLIKPMKGDLNFGKDPPAAILDHGITAWTLDGLGDKVSAKLQEVGRSIDALAQSPQFAGKRVDVSGALQPLDAAMAEAKATHNTALYDKLREAHNQLYFEAAEVTKRSGKTTLRPYGPRNMKMSPYEALKFKRMIGDRVQWTKDPLQQPLNVILGEAYRHVDGVLDTALPETIGPSGEKISGLRELNHQYSDLVGAAKAIQRRIPVAKRNAHWSLSDIALGTHSIPMAVARKVGMMPIVRTTVPGVLYRLPEPAPLVRAAPVAGGAGRAVRTGTPATTPAKKAPAAAAPTAAEASADDPLASMPDTLAQSSQSTTSSLANAISGAEGFGQPLTVPTLANNPGALELGDQGHGVMQAANGQKITIFGSLQEGRAALDHQLQIALTGKSSKYSPDMTLEQFGKIYSGGNANYGAQLATSLGVAPSTTLGELAPPEAPEEAPEEAPPAKAAAPLPTVKAEAQKRKPSPAIVAAQQPATAPNPPNKKYWRTATGPKNHRIGTDDGVTWFDVITGQQVL